MSVSARRDELKAFLRGRRAAVPPEQNGLQRGKRRLTPGLRREEVAALAGVGLTWYTWLEQGRDINVSGDTLRRIARVLRLSTSDEAYLFSLAGIPTGGAPLLQAPLPPTARLVIDGFSAGPAFALGPTMNVLAFNRLADLVYDFDGYDGRFADNHLWRGVVDPSRRRLYSDWENSIRNFVALYRLQAASYVGEPEYAELITALCSESHDFSRIWSERETVPSRSYLLELQHSKLGALRMHSVRLLLEGFGGVVFFLPPADAATSEKMGPLT